MGKSILTKNQERTFTKVIKYDGEPCRMTVNIRYNNTFSITGSLKNYKTEMYGCVHEEIKKYFPKFKHLIKWHLCNSDGPMYYIANTKYWVENDNIINAKKCAIWGVTPLDTDKNVQLLDNEEFLTSRLPFLLEAFKKDIEALGFKY